MIVILLNLIKVFQFCPFEMALSIGDINQNPLFMGYGDTTLTDLLLGRQNWEGHLRA